MSTVTNIILRGALVQMQSLCDQIQFHNYVISQTFCRHFRTVHSTHCLVCGWYKAQTFSGLWHFEAI